LAAVAGLLALFVARMWPVSSAATSGAMTPTETAHLLSWIVFLPIGGAIAVLFMPRQSHAALRWTTVGLMLATLVVSLPLLRIPMGRTYHFNEDVVWIARYGIHYHVAIDGISLWLVLLTVFITPI